MARRQSVKDRRCRVNDLCRTLGFIQLHVAFRSTFGESQHRTAQGTATTVRHPEARTTCDAGGNIAPKSDAAWGVYTVSVLFGKNVMGRLGAEPRRKPFDHRKDVGKISRVAHACQLILSFI